MRKTTGLTKTKTIGGDPHDKTEKTDCPASGRCTDPATASLTYDDETQRIAKDKLANTNLDTELKGGIGKYKFYHKVDIDSSNSTLTLIAQYDYQNTKLEDLIDCITEGNKSSNLNFNLSSKWTKVGVAAKTHKGKTYIAITLQVKKT